MPKRKYLGENAFDIKLHRPIVLNGLRVSLGEIETILNQQPDIIDSYVRVLYPDPRSPRLIGYVIPQNKGEDSRQMHVRIKHILPMHLMPEQIVLLDKLPRTPDGKVDESLLPVPAPVIHEESVSESRGERFLLKLWKEMLKRDSVSADDDFFTLGGTDETALLMLGSIESHTGVNIPIEQLRLNSTLRALAKLLDASHPESTNQTTIELKPGKLGPVFLIPAAARTALSGMRFATRLREGIRVIGVEYPRNLTPLPAPQRVSALASHFIKQIRAIQPEGPYSLIGNCMGGVVAYEVMCQLKQSGQNVDSVVLIDCETPQLQSDVPTHGVAHYWHRLVLLLQRGGLLKAIQVRLTRLFGRPMKRRLSRHIDIRHIVKYLWDAKTYYRATARYEDHLLVVLNGMARETARGTNWDDIAPQAEVHYVEDTDHLDLVRSNHALDAVGELINTYLEKNRKFHDS